MLMVLNPHYHLISTLGADLLPLMYPNVAATATHRHHPLPSLLLAHLPLAARLCGSSSAFMYLAKTYLVTPCFASESNAAELLDPKSPMQQAIDVYALALLDCSLKLAATEPTNAIGSQGAAFGDGKKLFTVQQGQTQTQLNLGDTQHVGSSTVPCLGGHNLAYLYINYLASIPG